MGGGQVYYMQRRDSHKAQPQVAVGKRLGNCSNLQ